MLRRGGLYSSRVIEWRQARDAGVPAGPAGWGQPAADPADAQVARLRKEKAKLEPELAKARFVKQSRDGGCSALSNAAVSVDAHQRAR